MNAPPVPPPPDPTAVWPPPDAPPAGPPPREMPQFERTRMGYHTAQVESFISRLYHHIGQLEHELASRVREVPAELVHAAESPAGQKTIAELVQLAADEITGQQAAAQQQVAQLIADAEKKAAKLVSDAEAQAARVVAGAHEQAGTVLADARATAKATTDQASAKALAVSQAAERRLNSLVATHEETTRRLEEIHRVTGGMLEADRDRGTLQDEVQRATQAAPGFTTVTVAPAARPQLTATAKTAAGEPEEAQTKAG
jgi:cell division septum initiation protein DivIVA